MQDVRLELVVALDPFSGMPPSAVHALPDHAVDAVELQLSGVELVAQRLHQPQILVLMEMPVARREDQDLRPRVPEHQQFHVPIKTGAIPAVVFSIHRTLKKTRSSSSSSRCCCSPRG